MKRLITPFIVGLVLTMTVFVGSAFSASQKLIGFSTDGKAVYATDYGKISYKPLSEVDEPLPEMATAYCVAGQTVKSGQPAVIAFTGGTVNMSLGISWVVNTTYPDKKFFVGFLKGTDSKIVLLGNLKPEEYLEPGWSGPWFSIEGPCVSQEKSVTHVLVCKYLPRSDGKLGLAQQISVDEWNNPKGQYFDAPAANWVDGYDAKGQYIGLTCDNPESMGFKYAGYSVAWGGKKDPNNDPKGVRASGFNDIYKLWLKG